MASTSPPVIGISGMSTDSKSVAAMVASVRAMGAIPMVFANHANRDPAADIAKVDAVIVMGNDYDVDPTLYVDRYAADDPRHQLHAKTNNAAANPDAQARAQYEYQLLRLAQQRRMPTLGVCAAMQFLNVMQGGGLLQHIPDLLGNEHHAQNTDGIPPFCPVTRVEIDMASSLGQLAAATSSYYRPSGPYQNAQGYLVDENSFHHQAVDPERVGYGLRISAWSDAYTNAQGQSRRLPEAIEPDPNGPLAGWPMTAVQWHPEFGASALSASLVDSIVTGASVYAATHPRDRSRDAMAARAANIVSAGKSNRIPAKKAESYVAQALAAGNAQTGISALG